MKKKYTVLILCAVILISVTVGGFMFLRNGNALHEGRALISKNGEFIFIDERNSPIVMGNADERKFSGITDGDCVMCLYGIVLESYPGMADTLICIKLSDGKIDDIDSEVLNQLRELGRIDKK
ncbi:MAG: hypothetical protein UHM85_03845 [Acutalibacteraceae bacterium]|nr:hypothetical protein [Acutalibacteraceae bacterium]